MGRHSCRFPKALDVSNAPMLQMRQSKQSTQLPSNWIPYSFALIVGEGGHIATQQHFKLISLHFSKMWASSLSENFPCHFHRNIHESTAHQALQNPVRWNTVYHSIQFSLIPSGGIINSSTSFGVVAIFPVGHFITTPLLCQNLEKSPPANSTTPHN